MKFIVKKLET